MPLIDIDLLGVPAFTVAVGEDGSFRYDGLNAANTAVSGLTKAMVVGRTPHDYVPAAVADRLVANYRRCVEARLMQEYEEELDLPGGHKWWRTTLSPVVGCEGRIVQILGLVIDITEKKQAEIELRSAAFKDPLTGICNRRRFERDLENAVAKARDTGRPFTVVLADVDRFKPINDTHGHGVGDAVLKAIAWRLAAGIRDTDRLARIGGDEFAAILSAGSEGAIAVALDRLRGKLAGPLRIGALDLIVGVSLGSALWAPAMSTDDVMAAADAAMYRQKDLRAA
ncbi:GGDEF domain-containing protein [Aureimonas leprariae]|uniref:GGDEF domain-containing protein n=1 Tax=Plantimonas leprariae TaxID=2615207 RepID=A0A7V7TWA5_9HYPH|nr:GGDEF domain-containing protein [Aureimonas leprariae]KAB0679306.1 GGDEF domain-containing protein [Aureimonas leprariae]